MYYEFNHFFSERQELWSEKQFIQIVSNNYNFSIFLMENLNWSAESALNRKDELRQIYFGDLASLSTLNFERIQDKLATVSALSTYYAVFRRSYYSSRSQLVQ